MSAWFVLGPTLAAALLGAMGLFVAAAYVVVGIARAVDRWRS